MSLTGRTRARLAALLSAWAVARGADDVIQLESPGDIALVADDLSSDGHSDLAAIHRDGEAVEVFLNRGRGNFEWADRYRVEKDSAPLYGAAGRIDHDDAFTDIVTYRGDVGGSTGFFTVGSGDGRGKFSPPSAFRGGGGTAMAIGDLDRDGFLDRAAAGADGAVELFFRFISLPGEGQPLTSSIEEPGAIVPADLNGDGLLDLLVWGTRSTPHLAVFLASGPRQYGDPVILERTPEPVGQPIRGAATDLDRDGRDEAILISSSAVESQVFAFIHVVEMAGDSLAFRRLGSALRIRHRFAANLQVLDLDGDGVAELLIQGVGSRDRDGVRVLGVVPGEALALEERCFVPFPGEATFFAAADFNENGSADLAVALRLEGDAAILHDILAPGRACEPAEACYASSVHAGTGPVQAAAVAPGEAPAVYALARGGAVELMSFERDGPALAASFPGPVAIGALAFADLSGDAQPDLVIADASTGALEVQPLLGIEPGGERRRWPLAGPAAGCVLADWNGDGALDIAVALPASGQVAVLLHGEGEALLAPASHAAGTAPTRLAAGDIDKDGLPDVVATNAGTSRIAVLRGAGQGKLGTPELPRVVLDPRDVAIADLGSDGTADIAVVSGDTSALAILTVSGDTFAPRFHALPHGTLPTAVVAGDLDGDQFIDLELAAAGANAALVFHGSAEGLAGAATPADPRLRQVTGGEALLIVADLDLNGWKDLLLIDQSTGGAVSYLALGCGREAHFRRGDSDLDGALAISDAIRVLVYLFAGGAELACQDAADADDGGQLNIGDPIYLLQYLFAGGAPPPAPGLDACGPDTKPDALAACEALCFD